MDRSELEIIKELMAELEDKMQPGHEDFEERLGRQKPGVEMVKIEGEKPDLDDDLMNGMVPEGARPNLESEEMEKSDEGMPMEEMDPEAKLKERLMKLRA